MTIKKFLYEQKYAYLIAKIAIVFQTTLTLIIGTLLVLLVCNINYPEIFLSGALVVDMLFVCTHLSYRGMYTGPKVTLQPFEKSTLIYHVISSVLALSLTSYIVLGGLDVTYERMCLALASWFVSLVTGVIFFYKKYKTFL